MFNVRSRTIYTLQSMAQNPQFDKILSPTGSNAFLMANTCSNAWIWPNIKYPEIPKYHGHHPFQYLNIRSVYKSISSAIHSAVAFEEKINRIERPDSRYVDAVHYGQFVMYEIETVCSVLEFKNYHQHINDTAWNLPQVNEEFQYPKLLAGLPGVRSVNSHILFDTTVI